MLKQFTTTKIEETNDQVYQVYISACMLVSKLCPRRIHMYINLCEDSCEALSTYVCAPNETHQNTRCPTVYFSQATHFDQWVGLQGQENTRCLSFFFGMHTSSDIQPHLQTRIIHPLSPFMMVGQSGVGCKSLCACNHVRKYRYSWPPLKCA